MDYTTIIKNKLNDLLLAQDKNHMQKYVIYPFGELGVLTHHILTDTFHIQEAFILDNHVASDHLDIHPVEYLRAINCKDYTFLFICENTSVYTDLYHDLTQFISPDQIIDFFPKTKIGYYSYGPLAYPHPLVAQVGSFCSFAEGVDAVPNHLMTRVSTHPFMYLKNEIFQNHISYIPGIITNEVDTFAVKSTIGNDVWLGRNVTITNGANIGNGVVAGAGAVIVKDIPDYAVVVGVPARIIKYRIPEELIDKMNQIAWWNWPIEKIKECYNDFMDIPSFIEKHYKK